MKLRCGANDHIHFCAYVGNKPEKGNRKRLQSLNKHGKMES